MSTIKQLSVFVENKPGKLGEFTKLLSEHNIDMRALSIAETPDFGILRLIVDDPYKTTCVLKDADYIFSITPVIAVAIPDEPGSLSKIVNLLGEAEINVEYTYAFITRNKDLAYMIFRVQDNDKAIDVLSKNDIQLVHDNELYDL